MRHRLILEKYKFDNFKCLRVHIYIPNGYFYLRWAGQTKFTVLQQKSSLTRKRCLKKRKKNIASPVRTSIIAFFHEC